MVWGVQTACVQATICGRDAGHSWHCWGMLYLWRMQHAERAGTSTRSAPSTACAWQAQRHDAVTHTHQAARSEADMVHPAGGVRWRTPIGERRVVRRGLAGALIQVCKALLAPAHKLAELIAECAARQLHRARPLQPEEREALEERVKRPRARALADRRAALARAVQVGRLGFDRGQEGFALLEHALAVVDVGVGGARGVAECVNFDSDVAHRRRRLAFRDEAAPVRASSSERNTQGDAREAASRA